MKDSVDESEAMKILSGKDPYNTVMVRYYLSAIVILSCWLHIYNESIISEQMFYSHLFENIQCTQYT